MANNRPKRLVRKYLLAAIMRRSWRQKCINRMCNPPSATWSLCFGGKSVSRCGWPRSQSSATRNRGIFSLSIGSVLGLTAAYQSCVFWLHRWCNRMILEVMDSVDILQSNNIINMNDLINLIQSNIVGHKMHPSTTTVLVSCLCSAVGPGQSASSWQLIVVGASWWRLWHLVSRRSPSSPSPPPPPSSLSFIKH